MRTLPLLLEMDDAELLELLGSQLVGEQLGSSPADRDRQRRFAGKWLTNWLDTHRASLCADERVQRLAKEPDDFAEMSVAIIVTVLEQFVTVTGVAATLAIILMRRGLHRICAEYLDDDG